MPISSVPTLANIRRQRKLTQVELARALGVTPVTIGNWESGRSSPPLKTLIALAEVLGVPVSKLLTAPT